MPLMLLALVLICTTGCGPRYVVTNGEETITVKKSVLDDLYRDASACADALDACRAGK